jgi:hypothetical protein
MRNSGRSLNYKLFIASTLRSLSLGLSDEGFLAAVDALKTNHHDCEGEINEDRHTVGRGRLLWLSVVGV